MPNNKSGFKMYGKSPMMKALVGKTEKKPTPLNVKSFLDTCSKRSLDELVEMEKIIKIAIKNQKNNVVVELPNKKVA